MDDYDDLPPLKKLPTIPEEFDQPRESKPLILDMVEAQDPFGEKTVERQPSFLTICKRNFQPEHVKKVIELHNLHLETINTKVSPKDFVTHESYEYFRKFTNDQALLALQGAQQTGQFLEEYFKSDGADTTLLDYVDDYEAPVDVLSKKITPVFTHV